VTTARLKRAAVAFEELARSLCSDCPDVVSGQMFGKPCLKLNGKAFVAQQAGFVIFKLPGADREKAMHLSGAELWDPSGRGRPMKEWVAVTAVHHGQFRSLSDAAISYVTTKETP
jgi:hypothetical protein